MTDINFTSRDKRCQLTIRDLALSTIINQCRNSGHYETGGILVGYYSDELDQAIVTQVTHKPNDSLCGKFNFVRGINGLANYFKKIWLSRRYYLGEWHFHPFNSPDPSNDDFKALMEIERNANYLCATPIMIIVGGDPSRDWRIRVFVCSDNKDIIELSGVVS